MVRCLQFTALALVVSCGPGLPEDDTTGGTSGTSRADETTTGGVPTTSGPVSTTPAADTSTGADTSTDATTTTTAMTTIATTGSTGGDETAEAPPFERCEPPPKEWHNEHFDCVLDQPTMTQVHGEGPAGTLPPTTHVFFGVTHGACDGSLRMNGMTVGADPMMPDAAVFVGRGCGPDGWLGGDLAVGKLSPDAVPLSLELTIDGFVGDWDDADPVDDPPRILGSFTGDLVGAFEAVHCAALDGYSNNCG